MHQVNVTEVELTDSVLFHGWYEAVQEVWTGAWPGDPPWASEEVTQELFADREDDERILFVATAADGEVVGAAEVALPKKDNLHIAHVKASVRPAHRGSGFGRALLEVAEQCASDNSRTVHLSDTSGRTATLESSEARFAVAAGFSLARREVRRELTLPLKRKRIEELETACSRSAAGYRLVSWSRSCPTELVAGRAWLDSTLSADEPRGDLDLEDEQIDAARVRRWETNLAKTGRELVGSGAISEVTGELVAFTELGPRPGDDVAIQFATVVAREHRGHRLGIFVKLANLKLVADQAAKPARITTWNGESNEHMIRVNEAFGFEIIGTAFNWQKTLG